jgi:asparagine synthase (glutamine-hydrolysing)
MCGIIGVCSKKPIESRDWLITGRDAMKHRGPDSAGIWWSEKGNVGFAHRRLSIIDLSEKGHQPMHDSQHEISIVLNGEIYNYQELKEQLIDEGFTFNSTSDTEVVIASWKKWGTKCVDRFNGMFAFAIHDFKKEIVFVARDRAGEKPLFYSLKDGELRFSSEIKGLLSDENFPRKINRISLDSYLSWGFVPGDSTMIDGIQKLPPAHTLLYNLRDGKKEINKFWKLPEYESNENSKDYQEEDLIESLESLLADAVEKQLVADVPVGVLLSGGLDSSLITALASRVSNKIKTFTVSFPGYSNHDESNHAKLIADYFQTDHKELSAGSIHPDIMFKLARQFDEPMIDSSMIPTYLVSKLVREHCTVAIGGDGGDELFGGYKHYNRLLWTKDFVEPIPRQLRNVVAHISNVLLPIGFKGRYGLQSLSSNFNSELPILSSIFDQKFRNKLINNSYKPWVFAGEEIRKSRIPSNTDLLQRITRMDFNNYLSEDILVKVDRASMLNSLELRAPLLDYRVIEFAYGKIPSTLKTTKSERKILLKKLASKILPSGFDYERKQGFSIPLDYWLKSPIWLNFFKDTLLDKEQRLFDHKTINRIFEMQEKGISNGERLFGLVLFELWRREYNISL